MQHSLLLHVCSTNCVTLVAGNMHIRSGTQHITHINMYFSLLADFTNKLQRYQLVLQADLFVLILPLLLLLFYLWSIIEGNVAVFLFSIAAVVVVVITFALFTDCCALKYMRVTQLWHLLRLQFVVVVVFIYFWLFYNCFAFIFTVYLFCSAFNCNYRVYVACNLAFSLLLHKKLLTSVALCARHGLFAFQV